jgi:streptogramin lyase
VAVDNAGSVYVADAGNGAIRVVTPVETNWVVSTLATGFSHPVGVALDTNGNAYVSDYGNGTISKVTPAGMVATLASGFNDPQWIGVDSAGNVYVPDWGANTISKVTPSGVVTTRAGCATCPPGSADGEGSAARFSGPNSAAVDTDGNLYVSDWGNNTIRKVTPAGAATTLAGLAGSYGGADGTRSAAQFWGPRGAAVDSAGNVYVADGGNNTIRKGIPASSVPAPILQPPSLSAGQFGFGISGLPGLAVDIESSGDLSQWQLVGTSILEGGTNYFVSPNPPQGAQFYRGHVR